MIFNNAKICLSKEFLTKQHSFIQCRTLASKKLKMPDCDFEPNKYKVHSNLIIKHLFSI